MNPIAHAEDRERAGLLAVPDHVTVTERGPGDIHRYRCSCGDVGRWQWVKSLAESNAVDHIRTAT